MRQCFIYIFIALILGCADTTRVNEDLNNFNEFLGNDKAEALNQAVESFHSFLDINYPDKKTLGEKTEAFLKELAEAPEFDLNDWKFEIQNNSQLVKKFENSSLRKDIYLYQYETYEPYNVREVFNHPFLYSGKDTNSQDLGSLELDFDDFEEEEIYISEENRRKFEERERILEEERKKALSFNEDGKFLYALAKFNKIDTTVINYVYTKIEAGDLSLTLIASGLLYNRKPLDLEKPFTQRVIVAEIYYPSIRNRLR
jgi:hypothetical protein